MATKKTDSPEDAIKKIHEKYGNDPDKLAEAYGELMTKLSTQGDEVGTLRKQTEDSQAALKQYEATINQLSPVVTWYNQPETQKQLQAYNAWLTQQQNQPAPAQATSASGNGVGILQPDEVSGLYEQFAKRWNEEQLKPVLQAYDQQWKSQAEAYVNQAKAEQAQQLKALSDVQWKVRERTTPKEQLEQEKQYQEAALRFADPKQHDPMKFASEFLDLQSERDTFKAELDTMKADHEKQEQAGLGMLNGAPHANTSFFADMEATPKSRAERFATTMKETTDAVGSAKVHEEFPGT